ncbi:MAG: GGDEF domain-containing protein, partial [Gammaproteobacteria bacterium]
MTDSTAHMSKHPDTFDHAMANKLLGLLGALRRSESGGVLYRQIEGMLDQLISYHSESEQLQLDVINALLEAFARQLPEGSSPQVELQLLQSRLKPPVTVADLEALREFLNVYADQFRVSGLLDAGPIEEAIEPLLHLFENKDVPPTEPVVVRQPEKVVPLSADLKTASVTAMGSHATLTLPVTEEPQGSGAVGDSASDQEAVVPQERGGTTEHDTENTTAEVIVDSAVQSSGRQRLRDMPNDLAQQVLETISQNQEFGVLLEVVENELREANQVDDIESLRWTIIRQVEKLAGEHHNLASKLDGTHQYLKMVESDSRQLSDELSRVRLLSLTDELTGLPNRRAFLRRLEDEVARVQRYGFPLSMALIDLDKFKHINDQYGHAGGDEVLRIYSKNILSIFRHHDLV